MSWRLSVLLAVLVFLAGCISQQPERQDIIFDWSENPVKAGQETFLDILFVNSRGTLENFTISLIDDGTLSGECDFEREFVRDGDVISLSCPFYAGPIKGHTEVVLKLSYERELSLYLPNIIFQSEEEHERNTSKPEQISASASHPELRVDVSFSKPMPFISGDNVSMRMRLSSPKGIVRIKALEIEDRDGIVKFCYGMRKSGNRYIPKRDVLIRNGVSDEMACVLSKEVNEPLKISRIKIRIAYSYEEMHSVGVVVE